VHLQRPFLNAKFPWADNYQLLILIIFTYRHRFVSDR